VATEIQQVVVFELSGETYAMDIDVVKEIIPTQPVTPVPGAPEYIEGLINQRNRVFPVIDLRKRFGLELTETDDKSRIIVLQVGDDMLGIIVDTVSDVMTVASDMVEPAGRVVSGLDAEFIGGIAKVEGRLVAVLQPAKIFAGSEEEL